MAFLSILAIFVNDISINLFSFKNLNTIVDVYKNFLFSDNYLSFIGLILLYIFKSVLLFLVNIFSLLITYISFFIHLILGDSLFNIIITNLSAI